MVAIMMQLLSFNFWSLVGRASFVLGDLTPHTRHQREPRVRNDQV